MDRENVRPSFALPPYFRCNIKPPMLPCGRQTIYFFPAAILVFDGERVGAVAYSKLDIHCEVTRFIESEAVPSDSRQVGQTWQYVNKNGGPDRRFSNNHQSPLIEYVAIHLRSVSGLNEAFHISPNIAGQAFGDGLTSMR